MEITTINLTEEEITLVKFLVQREKLNSEWTVTELSGKGTIDERKRIFQLEAAKESLL